MSFKLSSRRALAWLALISTTVLCTVSAQAEVNIDKLAKSKWLQLVTEDFDIITDLNEKKALDLVQDLEAYRFFQQRFFGVKLLDDLPRLRILALGKKSNFHSMGLPELWAGVFVIADDRFYAIANVENYSSSVKNPSFGRHVLLHEYTHFLSRFSQKQKNYPLWFEEGSAEYMATFKFDKNSIYVGNPKAILFRTQGLYNAAGILRMETEETFKTKSLPVKSTKFSDQVIVEHFYGRAFFIMHYFNSDPALRQSLGLYLGALKAGMNEDEALAYGVKQTWAELDKSIEKYVTSGLLMRVIGLKDAQITFPEPKVNIKKVDAAQFKKAIPFFISAESTPN